MPEQIEQYMRTLKLGGLAKEWRSITYRDPEQYVRELLEQELREREANRINRMIKIVGFQVIKTLEEFIWNVNIELSAGLTKEYMEELWFFKSKENLIFLGSVGTGEDPSNYCDCLESLPTREKDPFLYRGLFSQPVAGRGTIKEHSTRSLALCGRQNYWLLMRLALSHFTRMPPNCFSR